MEIYLNIIKDGNSLNKDIKELIPCMNTRRRMGALLKSAVGAGVEAIDEFEQYGEIDAIITASWLGCINDSEKFLKNMIQNNEQQLNPTPFIQSTFNTIGAQIALIKKLNCYNVTYSQGRESLSSALTDAYVKFKCEVCNNILVGIFDEVTPSIEKILERLNIQDYKSQVRFFILSNKKCSCTIASYNSLNHLITNIK